MEGASAGERDGVEGGRRGARGGAGDTGVVGGAEDLVFEWDLRQSVY